MTTILELDDTAFDALIARLTEAKEHGLALSAEDVQLVLDALLTLASLQERLSDKDITLHKLRKLLGIVKSSEKLSDLLKGNGANNNTTGAASGKASKRPRKKPSAPKVKPRVEQHKLTERKKGDTCPECLQGTLYKYEPARLLRITGNTAFTPVEHILERLRCNACGQFFTAELPDDVKQDGDSQQRYGYSARSVMALQKYFGGAPFYRQESLQALLGMPVSASTVFDQCEYLANDLFPVFNRLKQQAASAIHFHIDDTSNRILTQAPITKKRAKSDNEQIRSGVYSSGLIATLKTGQAIVLFNTDIGHAGEWLDTLLQQRPPDLSPSIVMSDALSSNHVSTQVFIKSLCNAHGRRQFVDVLNHFPEDVEWVLNEYARIWKQDSHTQEQNMTPEQRQEYHHTHSLPLMQSIRDWGQEQLQSQAVEENSGLGKAIRYFDRHFDGLTRFCTQVGAEIDNNLMEQQLKLIVRNRKNAGFFKTAVGAQVGDVITSIIATAARCEVNVFEYMNALQRHAKQVKANPERWLPWCYEAALSD